MLRKNSEKRRVYNKLRTNYWCGWVGYRFSSWSGSLGLRLTCSIQGYTFSHFHKPISYYRTTSHVWPSFSIPDGFKVEWKTRYRDMAAAKVLVRATQEEDEV